MTLHDVLEKMDRQHWVRLAVCVVPAMVLAKLGTYEGTPAIMKIVGSLALATGFGVYAFWSRIRQPFQTVEEDGNEAASATASVEGMEEPAMLHIAKLRELRMLCANDFSEVLHLLETEAALHPDWTLPAVIAEACHRKAFSLRSQSGS